MRRGLRHRPRVRRDRSDRFRYSEIEDLDAAIAREHDVVRLDVSGA
jgi:hypothetical protein